MMGGMKQTGIRWIGEVPETWTLLKMKHFSYMKGRIGWQGLTADEFIEEGPYLITGTDFENGKVCWDRCYHISEKRYNEAIPIQVQVGDLLVTKDGTIGKLAYIDEVPDKASLNSHLLVIRPIGEKYVNKFLYWVLYSSVFQGYYEFESYGSTMDSLSQEKIGEFSFYAPSIDEQERIADYLNNECAKLDEVIDTLRHQANILKKYRNSLVSETITKGLAKDVAKKNSYIPWIGEIPEHWSIKRLKYMLEQKDSMRVGPFGSALSTDEYTEEGKWVYTQRVVLDNNFEENDAFISEEKYRELIGFKVKPGDILLTTRGTIGRTAIVPENAPEGVLHPCIIRFRFDKQILLPELAQLIFNESDFVRKQFVYMSNATTIDVIYSYSLKEVLLPVIPVDEQEEILSFLKEKLLNIDIIIKDKELQLKTMIEHKRSMIYEYVTGKRRVKEVK